jgi:serine/threonine protein kinase
MPIDTTIPTQLGIYEVVSKIAEGGMGTVYKAKNRNTGEIVAIKVIAPTTAKNPVLLQRFEREFVAAKVLDHPNVVKAIDYCSALPNPFIVMEFVDGLSIGQRIEQKGAYPEAEAVRLIKQVCDGLQGAHKQGLVHRDVKPDNILVTREGVAKLTDMGLVKDLEGDLNLTRTGRGLGTPHYMAPEQFRNAKSVDVRGDIYSLGATLYAMVTGVIPFGNASPLDCWMKKIRNEFASPRELNPAVSERVDWAIRRAMSAEPSQRPSSCREFVEDLTGQGQSRTTPTATAPPPPPPTADVWYLVYRDENNQPHTVKGSTEGIRKALRDRLLGDPSGILVSRAKNGQFVPLQNTPEFRDLVVTPTPMPLPQPAPRQQDPNETTDYGGQYPPGGSGRTPRPPQPGSGRSPLQPPQGSGTSGARNRQLPPTEQPVVHDLPEEGTVPYSYNPAVPVSTPTPSPRNNRRDNRRENRANRDDSESTGKQPFNWTPILVILVAVLLGVIVVLLLK